jgi:TPR repeat protein
MENTPVTMMTTTPSSLEPYATTNLGHYHRGGRALPCFFVADQLEGPTPAVLEMWLERARDGSPSAAFSLGLAYDNAGDFDEAKSWYRKALEVGDHREAAYNLALLLMDEVGDGMRALSPEAEALLRRAADAGHLSARYNLALSLADADRMGEARTEFRSAAERGHVKAAFHLGRLIALDGSDEEAEEWLRFAASNGHAEACNVLGGMLSFQGRELEGIRWLDRATAAGWEGAAAKLANAQSRTPRATR